MGEQKSKFPDFQEILSMGKKLVGDVKKSFCELIENYKQKRAETSESKPEKKTTAEKAEEKTEKPKKKTAAKKEE